VVLRGQRVIIDSELAALYGVETKRFNEAIKPYRMWVLTSTTAKPRKSNCHDKVYFHF
jgi:hypothetical protein